MASSTQTTMRAKVLPLTEPPFTLADLKKAIPPHCFKRLVPRSFSYLIRDLAVLYIFSYVATNYFSLLPNPLFSYVVWPAYWFGSGAVLFGYWLIAHECIHFSFSEYPWLDNTLGMIIHTSLCVPYFSFRATHRIHHTHTGSIDSDNEYVAKLKNQIPWLFKYMDNPPGRVLKAFLLFVFGWYMYMIFNYLGRNYKRFVSHFDPYSPLFTEKERHLVWISNAGLLAFGYVLYSVAMVKGLPWVLCVYGGPLVMMNIFLIMVTFLNHNHPSIPHYNNAGWDWLRGALATVDRDYGILNNVFHNVTDTHILHHFFPSIPHYHCMEATNAIKPILGDYYNFDGTPILKAIYREAKECVYVEADEGNKSKGVYWFKKKL